MDSLPETTIVLADNEATVREGFAALFAQAGVRVVGECPDGSAAVEMIASRRPDFAVLDLDMPVITGLDVVRRLRALGSTSKLMILTINRDESCIMDALRAGADAYLLKDGPFRHVLEAMAFVRDGGVYVSPLLRRAGLPFVPRKFRKLTSLNARSIFE